MTPEYRQQQEHLVRTVACGVTDPWLRIVINYEAEYSDEGLEEDCLGFYIIQETPETLGEVQYHFSKEVLQAFQQLNEASLALNGQHWSVCDLAIDHTGKFKMNFSFDAPPRINGIFDDESYYRFGNYLETYKPL